MFALVLGMLVCVAVSAAVIAYAAREAQRESREFWTPEGERLIAGVRRRGTELKAQGEGMRQHARRATVRGAQAAGDEQQTVQTDDPPAPAGAYSGP